MTRYTLRSCPDSELLVRHCHPVPPSRCLAGDMSGLVLVDRQERGNAQSSGGWGRPRLVRPDAVDHGAVRLGVGSMKAALRVWPARVARRGTRAVGADLGPHHPLNRAVLGRVLGRGYQGTDIPLAPAGSRARSTRRRLGVLAHRGRPRASDCRLSRSAPGTAASGSSAGTPISMHHSRPASPRLGGSPHGLASGLGSEPTDDGDRRGHPLGGCAQRQQGSLRQSCSIWSRPNSAARFRSRICGNSR